PGVGGPAADELRQNGGTPGESTLKRILEIEQAEVILAALPNDDLPRPLLGIREQFGPLAVELALKRLGEGRDPYRPTRLLRPQRRRREVSESLADSGSRFGK